MIQEPTPIPFVKLLTEIESHDEQSWVYLPAAEKWTLISRSLVLQSLEAAPQYEDDPDAGIPPAANTYALMQALPVVVVQDIVRNARAQKDKVTPEELFEAFLHYYDHDTFLKLG
jgi:hypothetical protein